MRGSPRLFSRPALLALITVPAVLSAPASSSVAADTDAVGPAFAYWSAQKSVALSGMLGGFNQIASHAGQLRSAMCSADGEAFDAVLMDITSILAAVPGIAVRESSRPGLIRPLRPRPD